MGKESSSTDQGHIAKTDETKGYSNSLSYSEVKGTKETEECVTANAIPGYHRWIITGKAHVFAIVGYDFKTSSYFTGTYSIMDDQYSRYEDYSYCDGDYEDNQNSVIPFEVPIDIKNYVDDKLAVSEDLEISKSGKVTNYTGTDKVVFIPEYAVIENNDKTKTVVKVNAIDEKVFKGNRNLEAVKLSDFITEIPANAFSGCSSLNYIQAKGLNSVGSYAFSGCAGLKSAYLGDTIEKLEDEAFEGLEELAIDASCAEVVKAAVNSGAKKISIYESDKCKDLNNIKTKRGR